MESGFTTFDIVKIVELKIDRQKDWLNRGFIQASVQAASGAGTKNIFSRNDVYAIALFKQMVESGISRDSAKKATIFNFDGVRKAAELERDTWYIVDRKAGKGMLHWPEVSKEYYLQRMDPGERLQHVISKLFADGAEDILIVNIGRLVKEIDRKISANT